MRILLQFSYTVNPYRLATGEPTIYASVLQTLICLPYSRCKNRLSVLNTYWVGENVTRDDDDSL